MDKLLMTYYGDDFTGSTDVMESLALNGVPTALFLEPPLPEEITSFSLKNKVSGSKTLKAFGVAGISRSLSPSQMDQELPPIFEAISKIPSQFFQYKVCSTFDSSAEVGSIGHATELAAKFFPSRFIPLLIGAPSLNRFCVFGNLFARVGGVTYRLDRHPTMSKHPVTPMNESDLRIHLSHQTHRPVHLLDIFALEEAEELDTYQLPITFRNGDFVLFDILERHHLRQAGKLIYENRYEPTQLLVGSSGINYAIIDYLQSKGKIFDPGPTGSPGKAKKTVIMAGSAAPTTKSQIEWVISLGFEALRVDTEALVDPQTKNAEFSRLEKAALNALSRNQSVIIFAALGPDDPVIEQTKNKILELNLSGGTGELIARVQGELLKNILKLSKVKRVVVAGGDTSGYVARSLGIYALETLMPIAPGAPLCTAHSHDPDFDGLEISLKGGQNGNEKYFEAIMEGHKIE
ncbi:MAG: four-carbon acid sugar kinase family protein [Candidatus Cyclobacteriaceae bacterium M3_2C_046]